MLIILYTHVEDAPHVKSISKVQINMLNVDMMTDIDVVFFLFSDKAIRSILCVRCLFVSKRWDLFAEHV